VVPAELALAVVARVAAQVRALERAVREPPVQAVRVRRARAAQERPGLERARAPEHLVRAPAGLERQGHLGRRAPEQVHPEPQERERARAAIGPRPFERLANRARSKPGVSSPRQPTRRTPMATR
jgi:hypothetical protein